LYIGLINVAENTISGSSLSCRKYTFEKWYSSMFFLVSISIKAEPSFLVLILNPRDVSQKTLSFFSKSVAVDVVNDPKHRAETKQTGKP
jgi:hypothetical protein